MRIATGGITHETSTFINTKTSMKEFEAGGGVFRGSQVLEQFRGTNKCTGGFIAGSENHGFELLPLLWAEAVPSGPVVRQDYHTLKAEFFERLSQVESDGGPVDGVLLDMHGAMVVEGIEDADGDFVSSVRDFVGPNRPIIMTQDLHANHTNYRVASADAIIGFDTYPHVDMAERGLEAAHLIVQTINGEVVPVMAISQLPILWSVSRQVTSHHPMAKAFERVHEAERRPGILSVTLAAGFPFSDVPEVGASVIVVADAEESLARSVAEEISAWVWDHRSYWYQSAPSFTEAMEEATRIDRYPVIIADQADNTGSGSPGDSTEILQALVDQRLEEVLVLYMIDPEVADLACKIGPGGSMTVKLGGKSDPAQGQSVEMEVDVISTSNGVFEYDGPMLAGITGNAGPSAWLRSDGISVVVVSVAIQPLDQAFVRSLGIDCTAMRYIVVKSCAHFRSGFEEIAGSIHNVEARAIHSHNFQNLTYRNVKRDLYPLVD